MLSPKEEKKQILELTSPENAAILVEDAVEHGTKGAGTFLEATDGHHTPNSQEQLREVNHYQAGKKVDCSLNHDIETAFDDRTTNEMIVLEEGTRRTQSRLQLHEKRSPTDQLAPSLSASSRTTITETSLPGAVAVLGPRISHYFEQEDDDFEATCDADAAVDVHIPNATLVMMETSSHRSYEDSQQLPKIVKAEPALQGFRAIVATRHFKILVACVFVIFATVITPLLVLLSTQKSTDENVALPPPPLECAHRLFQQSDYRGTTNITKSGRICQRWDSQFPFSHDYDPEKNQQYDLSGLEENYCRNPNGEKSRAWCFTTDPTYQFDFCDIPNCDGGLVVALNKTCGKRAQRQEDYRGNISVTAEGITCQRWDSQVPHAHVRNNRSVQLFGLEENYCRNPNEFSYEVESAAWCYTTDPTIRYAHCSVPFCNLETSDESP